MSNLYIFDTDHITLLQKNHPHIVTRLAQLPPENVAVTIVSANRRDFELVPGLKIEDWSRPTY